VALRREEAEVLLRACNGWRDRFLLVVLWSAGLRVGEAIGFADPICTWCRRPLARLFVTGR